jgi:hypothetical protein
MAVAPGGVNIKEFGLSYCSHSFYFCGVYCLFAIN